MQNIVIDKPYTFVPPCQGRFWPALLQRFSAFRLAREFGVVEIECRGLEHLEQSRQAGHGMLLAPNHCRPCDPFVVSEAARRARLLPFTMASWHLFMQGRVQAWVLRHAGVFSVYREGMDRGALNAAIEILQKAERPLVIFPEGVVSRHNDRLNALLDGTAFIARAAAKKRAQAAPPGEVVIHPIAMKYFFRGDIGSAVEPTLDDIERRLTWRTQRELPLVERIIKIGLGLLALKEIEYLGAPQAGTIFERTARLIDALLAPLEREWLGGKSDTTVIGRVKKLRTAVLPDMVQGDIPVVERDRRWRQLADMYLAQQLSFYPPDYVRSQPTPERLLETVERFEEDLTDHARIYRPMAVKALVGEAIPVAAARDRGASEDPAMAALETQLQSLIASIQ